MRRELICVLALACGSRTELDGSRDAALVIEAGPCLSVTHEISVPATTPWTDTGIDVSAGMDVTIHASGKVRYGPLAPQTTDANGGNFEDPQFFPSSVFPKVIVCSLIGRVGNDPMPTQNGFVGVDYHEKMTSSGRLFLGFNDQENQFGDNSGAFDVSVNTQSGCH